MASFASSATTGGARKHAWTNEALPSSWAVLTVRLCVKAKGSEKEEEGGLMQKLKKCLTVAGMAEIEMKKSSHKS